MITHDILVSVDSAGSVICSPERLRAKRGQIIEWKSQAGPFAVDFGKRTPAGRPKGSSQKGRLEMGVRPDASLGRYKYFVAVAWNGQVITEDPEIIIEMF